MFNAWSNMCVLIFEFCEYCMDLCPEAVCTEKCWMMHRHTFEARDCQFVIYKVRGIVCHWCSSHVQ